MNKHITYLKLKYCEQKLAQVGAVRAVRRLTGLEQAYEKHLLREVGVAQNDAIAHAKITIALEGFLDFFFKKKEPELPKKELKELIEEVKPDTLPKKEILNKSAHAA